MNVFSASQAISPAIDRTKRYLFHPFEWSTYLKLAAVACITEGFSSNFNFSSNHRFSTTSSAFTPLNLSGEVIALIVIGILICIVIGIFIFYLITRLRFAFFHCLAHQTKEIRRAWWLYRAQAMRFFKANLVVGLIFLCVLVLVVLPFVVSFYRLYRSSQSGGPFDVAGFLLLLLPFVGIILCLCLVAYVVDTVLRDFILPHMAPENLSFRQSWAAVKPRIAAEKGSFAFYLFLRLVLPILAFLALFIVLAIPLLIIFGILVLIGVGLNTLQESATGVAAFVCVFFETLVGLFGVAFGLLVAVSLGGPIATWIRNFALLFYGGRYQALGDILSPPPPAPPPAPELT